MTVINLARTKQKWVSGDRASTRIISEIDMYPMLESFRDLCVPYLCSDQNTYPLQQLSGISHHRLSSR
jgi:hypothetical protein